ncbi:patatin-like phospholipase family protein [Ornithinimicrobium sp. INDO-MA30-4]|uniref:patatin-like phospholipase family protein n=1 Tax=Ornithinimicrobium sp. INDO-MA30-4 TaxID=2908651 RepID=UPI001F200DCE|nr:patatin-like phospholipase family protein [Ornithinimicrobium sp. INDO-MA30-4]UJH69582.1 patatin-like phospholipase family protein [Ornithinimicrobium sp. INDO-MA30-4]
MKNLPAPIAYVLGGGASLGAVHVGMLEALAESDVRPDMILGTSVGSLNGAILSEDIDAAPARLRQAWMTVERSHIFDSNLLHVLRQFRETRTSLVGAEGVAAAVAGALKATTFEQLPIPFAAVTVDLRSSRVCVIDKGPLAPALIASCSIPGYSRPLNSTASCWWTAEFWRTCRSQRHMTVVQGRSWFWTAPSRLQKAP